MLNSQVVKSKALSPTNNVNWAKEVQEYNISRNLAQTKRNCHWEKETASLAPTKLAISSLPILKISQLYIGGEENVKVYILTTDI